jgi:hypothetical protein
MPQVAFSTRHEDLRAEEATGRAIAAGVDDLDDQLTVICGLASLGAEVSSDPKRTESYFTLIESAGEKAAQITRQLLELDAPAPSEDLHTEAAAWPGVQHAIDATPDPGQAASSFRRRLKDARARAELESSLRGRLTATRARG